MIPRGLMTRRQAMEEMFKDFPLPFRLWETTGAEEIPLDMYQTDNAIVLRASLPGVKPDDVDVHVVGDTLVIKGEVRADTEAEEDDYVMKERRYGEFRRQVTLPAPVRAEKAEAVFEDGLLTLRLPKVQPEKPAQIKVNVRQ